MFQRLLSRSRPLSWSTPTTPPNYITSTTSHPSTHRHKPRSSSTRTTTTSHTTTTTPTQSFSTFQAPASFPTLVDSKFAPALVCGIIGGTALAQQHNNDDSWFNTVIYPRVWAGDRVRTRKKILPKVPNRGTGQDFAMYGGLSPMEFRPFRCSDISVMTMDTCLYCFNLATPSSKLNLPVSSYVLARSEIDGETVIRPYTPIANFTGELPVVVKTYPNAKMGGKFARLEVGDTMFFKGPFQTFVYEPNTFDRLTLVAGGTGVNPMMQLIDKVLTNPLDRTKMHLILANKDEYNMPLAAELNEFAETYPNRLRVTHVVEQPVTKDWDGLTGHISKELLMVSCGKPHPHHKVFVSGPPGLLKAVCGPKGDDYTQGEVGGIMAELGYTERDVFKF